MKNTQKKPAPGGGYDTVRQILKDAARKESFGKTVLKLAWTAGPVTYLALQGGYLLGYGQSAPRALFYYFAVYTVIAGIASLIVQFLYSVTRGTRLEQLRNKMELVLGRLPDLIMNIRDEQLEQYTGRDRDLVAARFMLENPDAPGDSVETAVTVITGDSRLGAAARKIELYRSQGLSAKVGDEYAKAEGRLRKSCSKLENGFPDLARLLCGRFGGILPSKKTGRERTRGFIQRVLAASEEGNLDLMFLTDAEEMLTLGFELIAGQEYPSFHLRFEGKEAILEQAGRIDQAMRNYRAAAYRRNSALRILSNYLASRGYGTALSSLSPVLKNSPSIYSHVRTNLESLYQDVSSGKAPEKIAELRKVLNLHKRLEQNDRRVKERLEILQTRCREYDTKRNNSSVPGKTVVRPLSTRFRGGVKITRRSISLPEKRRLAFISEFFGIFDETWWLQHKPGTRKDQEEEMFRQERITKIKETAVEIGRLLSRELKLDRFAVQHTIESSGSPFLFALDPNLTAKVKIEWAKSMIDEISYDETSQLKKLLTRMMHFHGITLSESAYNHLAEKYGFEPADLIPEDKQPGHHLLERIPEKPTVPVAPLPAEYFSLAEGTKIKGKKDRKRVSYS
ncbi:MAG: hypothetical protein ACLFSE_01930 [Spirochaetia bacterium]